MENFDFIADPKFKSILERDFQELDNCINNKLSKSAMVLSGSIIEAVLLEFFTHNLPEKMTIQQVYKLQLGDLLERAETINLISKRTKDLSVVVKDYRNLIHPGREIRTKEEFDYENATVTYNLLKIILKEIRENYLKKYGYKAEDIIKKIFSDSSTYHIFPDLLDKINNYEKIKLANMLIDYFFEGPLSDASSYYKYFEMIKKRLSDDELRKFCLKLHEEVENGSEENVRILFDLFGNNIQILRENEKNLILTYIYGIANKFSSYRRAEETMDYEFQKIFRHLGLYLYSDNIKEKFLKLLIKIAEYSTYEKSDVKYPYYNFYSYLTSNLSDEKIKQCEDYLKQSLKKEISEEFFQGLDKHNEFPF